MPNSSRFRRVDHDRRRLTPYHPTRSTHRPAAAFELLVHSLKFSRLTLTADFAREHQSRAFGRLIVADGRVQRCAG
jgi:hypothetical protein